VFKLPCGRQIGCFPLCQRFRKFRSECKWKGLFRFLPTGILGINFGGGPLILVGILQPKFAIPLINRFFALIREFGKGIKSGKSHSYWLAWFNRKMSFHFHRVFLLISERSTWHNGKHPLAIVSWTLWNTPSNAVRFQKLFLTCRSKKYLTCHWYVYTLFAIHINPIGNATLRHHPWWSTHLQLHFLTEKASNLE